MKTGDQGVQNYVYLKNDKINKHKMNTITITKKIRVQTERLLLWFQMVLFVAALSAYAYFIMLTVMEVVLRQELILSIQQTETKVSELEAEYFMAASTLTPDMATDYELVTVEPIAYLTVHPEGGRLTRNN